MRIIRKKAFETNSSSCHSLTYVKSNDPMSYLKAWKDKNPNVKTLEVTLKGYYNDSCACSVKDKLSYIFSDLVNHREDEIVASVEEVGDPFANGVSQKSIDAYLTGAFTDIKLNKNKLKNMIAQDERMFRLVKIMKDYAGIDLTFKVGGIGWIGVDHESVGTGASVMNLTDSEIIEVLFNGNNYFELGAW